MPRLASEACRRSSLDSSLDCSTRRQRPRQREPRLRQVSLVATAHLSQLTSLLIQFCRLISWIKVKSCPRLRGRRTQTGRPNLRRQCLPLLSSLSLPRSRSHTVPFPLNLELARQLPSSHSTGPITFAKHSAACLRLDGLHRRGVCFSPSNPALKFRKSSRAMSARGGPTGEEEEELLGCRMRLPARLSSPERRPPPFLRPHTLRSMHPPPHRPP